MPSKLEARIARHDREIAAIRKLVLTGMKMLVKVQTAQRKTEQTLERFIRSMERGGLTNGHKKPRP
ncbi:MAG TPA: hypothetical protein VM120_15075 [Bryobacteraceae bacterium]|nr:hypothetical protein [Bryobacteraceae bacterium]